MASEPRREPAHVAGERAARALRFEMRLGDAPIDIYTVIRERGIALAFRNLGSDDGRYLFHAGMGLVIVTTTTVAARQRFTAAHELGHHEMHRFVGEAETETYIVDRDVTRADGARREVEANAFASCLLLPSEALMARFPRPRTKIGLEQVIDLMRLYRVSLPTAVFRLHNTGRITPAHRDALLRAGDGQVQQLLGDPEDPRTEAAPDALVRNLSKLYRADLIPAERLGEALHIQAAQVVDRFGEPTPAAPDIAALLTEIGEPE